jgi:hypothetical protein
VRLFPKAGQRGQVAGAESASPQRSVHIASDSLANDKHHTEVDDLFAQWDSDPLELLSLTDFRIYSIELFRDTNGNPPHRRVQHARRLLLVLVLTLPAMHGSTRSVPFTRTFFGLRYQTTLYCLPGRMPRKRYPAVAVGGPGGSV